MRKIAFAIPILILALAACGQAAPSTAQPTVSGPTAAPPATSAPPTEAPPATAPPTAAPAATVPPPTDAPTATPSQPTASPMTAARPPAELVATARERLAQHLGVPAESLTLQNATQEEWPDGALGCPAAGQLYPQVITPGFLLVFSDGAKTYAVHTGGSEQQMILCEDGQPTNLANQASAPATPADAVQTSPANQPLVELARQALAKELGIDVTAIRLTQIEEVEWRDSSLGCPKPNMNYLQVITPGYRIVLEAQGRSYNYHTDLGKRVVRCDRVVG
jgi:hypothetical protein